MDRRKRPLFDEDITSVGDNDDMPFDEEEYEISRGRPLDDIEDFDLLDDFDDEDEEFEEEFDEDEEDEDF